ncbi:phosphatase, partial [Xanthomonas oryzae pv. oryzae]
MPIFDPARRQVLKCGAAVMAAGALGSLSALQSRQAQAATSSSTGLAPAPSRYGPLAPVA